MVNNTILRGGEGPTGWNATIGQLRDEFSKVTLAAPTLGIIAPGPGAGKSTVFEVLQSRCNGLAVEGDILSTIAAAHSSKKKLTDDMILGEIARGEVFQNWLPFDKTNNPSLYGAALRDFFGKDFNLKLSLTTGTHGVRHYASLYVMPDYSFYKENLSKRTKCFLQQSSHKDYFNEQIVKDHAPMVYSKFVSSMRSQLHKLSCPVFFIPNMDTRMDEELDRVMYGVIATLAFGYADVDLLSVYKVWSHYSSLSKLLLSPFE